MAVWVAIALQPSDLDATGTSPPVRPAITAGLLHYWPDLWDAQDEVTGQEGVIMAVLPPAAEVGPDEIPFHDETG